MQAFCPRCGAGLAAGSTACPTCGAEAVASATGPAPGGGAPGGNRALLVGLLAGFVVLALAGGILAWVLTRDGADDTASPRAAPPATTAPTTTTTAPTTTTTAPTTTTTLRRQAAPPDQIVPPPTASPPVVVGPPAGDRSGEAMEWVYDALVACIPDTAGTIVRQDAVALGPDRYRVETTMTDPVVGEFTVAYEVDFATEDFPNIIPLGDTAAAFICL